MVLLLVLLLYVDGYSLMCWTFLAGGCARLDQKKILCGYGAIVSAVVMSAVDC
jgi:hypothetical protein